MLNMYVRRWRFHIMFFMRRGIWGIFSGFIHKNKRVMIIRRRPLPTPQNRENGENLRNTMPWTVRLWSGHGSKSSAVERMLHPSALITDKWPNTCQRERVEGLLIVGNNFRLVRRGSPATDVFIMRHEDFPNKELYATKRMVHITGEGPKEDLFDLERP